MALFRRDAPEDDEQPDVDAGPFRHVEPRGSGLILRAYHYQAARKLYDSIFGPGSPLAIYAEQLRRQRRDRRP